MIKLLFFFSRDTHYLQISHFSPYVRLPVADDPFSIFKKKCDPIMLKLLLFMMLDLNSCLFWIISMQFAYIGHVFWALLHFSM